MRYFAFLSLLALTCVAASCARASADTPDNQHLCKAEDLHGVFIMINMTEMPEGEQSSWYSQEPYQYIAFYPPSHYALTAFDHSIDKLADLNALLKNQSKPYYTYTIDDQGVLELSGKKEVEYSFRCYAATDTSDINAKGDLLLSGHARGNHSELHKLYRPVTKDSDVH